MSCACCSPSIATEGIGRRLRGARWGLALELVGTIGAYLAKEQALILPAFAAVEAWVALGRPALDRAAVKRCIVVALPQAAVAIAYLVVRSSSCRSKLMSARRRW